MSSYCKNQSDKNFFSTTTSFDENLTMPMAFKKQKNSLEDFANYFAKHPDVKTKLNNYVDTFGSVCTRLRSVSLPTSPTIFKILKYLPADKQPKMKADPKPLLVEASTCVYADQSVCNKMMKDLQEKGISQIKIKNKSYTWRTIVYSRQTITMKHSEFPPRRYNYDSKTKEYQEDILKLSQWIRDLTNEGIEPNPGPKRMNRKLNKRKERTPLYRMRPPPRPQRKPLTKLQNFLDRRRANLRENVQGLRELVALDYEEAPTDENNSGGPLLLVELEPTNLYDIDPLILSRAIQFNQYKFDIYNKAKVMQALQTYTINNLEQHSLDVYLFHSTVPDRKSVV